MGSEEGLSPSGSPAGALLACPPGRRPPARAPPAGPPALSLLDVRMTVGVGHSVCRLHSPARGSRGTWSRGGGGGGGRAAAPPRVAATAEPGPATREAGRPGPSRGEFGRAGRLGRAALSGPSVAGECKVIRFAGPKRRVLVRVAWQRTTHPGPAALPRQQLLFLAEARSLPDRPEPRTSANLDESELPDFVIPVMGTQEAARIVAARRAGLVRPGKLASTSH